MANVKSQEISYRDEMDRKVRTQFITRNGRMDWIRITTQISKDVKLRSDYYRDENPELFDAILSREKGKIVSGNKNT